MITKLKIIFNNIPHAMRMHILEQVILVVIAIAFVWWMGTIRG